MADDEVTAFRRALRLRRKQSGPDAAEAALRQTKRAWRR
jgi:hypothetical protein